MAEDIGVLYHSALIMGLNVLTRIIPGNYVPLGTLETNNRDKKSTEPPGRLISSNKTVRKAAYTSPFSA